MIVDRSRRGRRAARIIGAWMRRKHFFDTPNFISAMRESARKRRLHERLFDLDVMLLRRKPKRRLPPRPQSEHTSPKRWLSDNAWYLGRWKGVRNPWLRKHVRL